MTLSDALHNILPFRKSSRDDRKSARELDIEKFIAERKHGLRAEEIDAIEVKALADAGIDEDQVRKDLDDYMREHTARPA